MTSKIKTYILVLTLFILSYSIPSIKFRGELPDAKSASRGFTGSTLTDNGSILAFNPALLGLKKDIGIGELVAVFEVDDYVLNPAYFQNSYTYTVFLQPIKLGISGNINYSLSYGTTEFYENGFQHFDNNYALFINLGLGKKLIDGKLLSHSLGTDLKLMYHHEQNDIGWQFGIDLGYLLKFKNGIGISLCINNMGNNFEWDFGDDFEGELSIPFNIDIAAGFEKSIIKNKLYLLKVNSEFSFKQFFISSENETDSTYLASPFYKAISKSIKENTAKKNREIHLGYSFDFFNTLHVGNGYVFRHRFFPEDKIQLDQILLGFGLNALNHININFTFEFQGIYTFNENDKNYTSENTPFRFSILIRDIFNWNKSDLKWWRAAPFKQEF